MTSFKKRVRFVLCAAVSLASVVATAGLFGQQDSAKVRADLGKARIERSTKAVIKESAPTPTREGKARKPRHDISKSGIEAAVKKVLEKASAPPKARPRSEGEISKTSKRNRRGSRAENPAHAPGRVKWHENYESALAASKRSGKPVLLFQLLGQLDLTFT